MALARGRYGATALVTVRLTAPTRIVTVEKARLRDKRWRARERERERRLQQRSFHIALFNDFLLMNKCIDNHFDMGTEALHGRR